MDLPCYLKLGNHQFLVLGFLLHQVGTTKKKKGFEQQLRELKSRLNRREAPATFSTEHEFFLIVPHVPMSERWRDLHCITLRQ